MKTTIPRQKIRNAYEEYADDGEGHPIDATVDAMIPLALTHRVRRMVKKIGAVPDIDQKLVLDLEEAWTARQSERETVVFNVAHALGVTAGATLSTTSQAKSEARALSKAIRPMVRLSGLSPSRAAATLIEIAWSIMIDIERR